MIILEIFFEFNHTDIKLHFGFSIEMGSFCDAFNLVSARKIEKSKVSIVDREL